MEESQALVVVPTVGDVTLVLGCVQRLLECTKLKHWQLAIVHNPVDENAKAGAFLQSSVESAIHAYNETTGNRCDFC